MMWLRHIPAWARWALYAAGGVFVLSVLQELDDTDGLTSVSASQAMLRWAVPILLAGLGGLFSERAGVVNIGLEGMMVLGTWFGAWGAVEYGAWAGILIGALGGALGGLLHAVATINFGVDHIISGVAINILAPGAARFLSSEVFTGMDGGAITQSPRVPGVSDFTMPFLAGGWDTADLLGDLGRENIFFLSDVARLLRGLMSDMSLVTLLALLLVPASTWLLWRTRFGLRLRVAGEQPLAGESQGIDIYRYKYAGVTISGALAGLGGAFIVSPELGGSYVEGQTNGRGFIGLAALIFGNWHPAGVLAGAMLFAYPVGVDLRGRDATHTLLAATALALAGVAIWMLLKNRKFDGILATVLAAASLFWYLVADEVPGWWGDIFPYVVVLVVLIFFAQRLRPPAAAGQRYRKGET